jgi:calcineurin-like phosphoesterase family protein
LNDKVLEKDFVLRAFKKTLNFIQKEPTPVRRVLRSGRLTASGHRRYSYERDQLVSQMEQALRSFENAELAETTRRRGVAPSGDEPFLPRNRVISLFQSALDSYLTDRERKHKRKPRASRRGTHAALGDPFEHDDPGWAEVAWEKLKLWLGRKNAPFKFHKELTDFMFPLEDSCSIALVFDWGTGIDRAIAVSKEIDKRAPQHAIHLGDVYYAGTENEVNERFLDDWPKNVSEHSWALNSNHEMYSGGYGYFKITLKKFGQPASYFCLRNSNWQIIGLDTGYVDHNLNLEQFEWLLHKVYNYSGKTVLLSHHQLFSAFDSQGENLEGWLGSLLDDGKIYAWFWGHEHRCTVYKPHRNIKARCIGHGGIPYNAHADPHPDSDIPVEWTDEREHPQKSGQGIFGFAFLNLDGANLHVQYIDEFGEILKEEDL